LIHTCKFKFIFSIKTQNYVKMFLLINNISS